MQGEMTAFLNSQKTSKPHIKTYTKNYCQKLNRQRQKEIAQIKRNIENESTHIRINLANIDLLHNQLQNLQNEKQRGGQIRSREKMV